MRVRTSNLAPITHHKDLTDAQMLYRCMLKLVIEIRGDKYKSGLLWLNAIFFAKMEPTKTYHIPNQWKSYEDFAELWKF